MQSEVKGKKPMHAVLDQINKLNEPLKNERINNSKPCINVDFSKVLRNLE